MIPSPLVVPALPLCWFLGSTRAVNNETHPWPRRSDWRNFDVSSQWRDNEGLAMPVILNPHVSCHLYISTAVNTGFGRGWVTWGTFVWRPGADWLVRYACKLLIKSLNQKVDSSKPYRSMEDRYLTTLPLAHSANLNNHQSKKQHFNENLPK